MNQILSLTTEFRTRIDIAHKNGLFNSDIAFIHFPRGCCGDSSELLARYLSTYGILTIYVCGTYHQQSHAWLVIKDERIHIPSPQYYTTPDEIKDILIQYGATTATEPIDISKYEDCDLADGIIIDITADQFGEKPVYIGPMDSFHHKFSFDFAHDYNGLGNYRLSQLYNLIMSVNLN